MIVGRGDDNRTRDGQVAGKADFVEAEVRAGAVNPRFI